MRIRDSALANVRGMLVVVVLILVVGFSVHAHDKERQSCRDAGNDFDIFVFAGLSPGADCFMTDRNKVYTQNCSVSGTPNWTIHGLWPSNTKAYEYDCKVPCYCNSSYEFNVTEIKELIPKLKRLWPALKNSKEWSYSCQNRSENEYLWCHEWDKHGTCASGRVQQIYTEFDFFSKVLDLFERSMNYDKYVLAKHDIIPSTSKPYLLESFVEAFYEEWKVRPVLICNWTESSDNQPIKGGGGGLQVIDSIRICLDKNTFTPIDCPQCVIEVENCHSDTDIYYFPA